MSCIQGLGYVLVLLWVLVTVAQQVFFVLLVVMLAWCWYDLG